MIYIYVFAMLTRVIAYGCFRGIGNEATGSLMVESGYDAMNMGNLLLGGIIGLGVDAATGAMWHYPSAVIIPLSCPGPS